MTQFHTLLVTNIQKTIRDAVVVTLEPSKDADFSFVQGQYLTFRREFDGVELRRSYSICTGLDDGLLKVGIKRVDGGAFSTWANTELEVGDMVEAMPPMGNFYSRLERDNPHYLLFAGGSGITPVLSILKTGLNREPDARFTLVYANRNPNTIMFRDELEDLKNLYMNQLNIIHILEDDAQDIELFKGRVDGEKCARLFKTLIDVKGISTVFICGPEPMMLAISDALQAHGVAKDKIRFELFASGQPGRAPNVKRQDLDGDKGIACQVTLNGETRSFDMIDGTSLLDAAKDNNIDAPFACKAGVCSTCKAKVLTGQVEMVTNHALEDYEVEAGYVLTCQSYPVTDKVSWDYDQAGH